MEKLSQKPSKLFNLLHSYHTKVTLTLIISFLFVGALCNFLIYQFALDQQFAQIQDKLKVIAQTAAFAVDADKLMRIPRNREGIKTPEYKEIFSLLRKIREMNAPIKYIYTMTKTDTPGMWQFLVDPDTGLKSYESGGLTSYPGDTYDASRFPEMLKAFDGPSVDKEIAEDEWGIILSGYAPIRDKTGKAVAMIGVDILADDIYALQQIVHRRGIFVWTIGAIFALTLGLIVSNGITYRVERIVEGTRRLREGDLRYRVPVKGHDEISDLARCFNEMSRTLFLSRKRMHNYFYRAMQSLVRVLEAKDQYTFGHSDRVAFYAEKIAQKMDFLPSEVEIVKEAAQLHDIGKLGIQKTILDKPGPLTPEEWKVIQQHPVIGEEILRPVVFDEEMLSMVRGHHEHYDGKGYPDKIKGEDINIFAQIISIADAYDAMTSKRPYRRAFSSSQAIEEIRKNKGVQFNPRVVDTAVEVFQSDKAA